MRKRAEERKEDRGRDREERGQGRRRRGRGKKTDWFPMWRI